MTIFVRGDVAQQLPEGLYESLRTEALAGLLRSESEMEPIYADVSDENAADILSPHVAGAVHQALEAAKPDDGVLSRMHSLR